MGVGRSLRARTYDVLNALAGFRQTIKKQPVAC
jgi:hypothetical protein